MFRRMLVCALLWPVFSPPVFGEDDAQGTAERESLSQSADRADGQADDQEAAKPVAVRELDASKVFGGGLAGTKVFLGKAPDHRAALCKGRTRDKPQVVRAEMTLTELIESETIRDRIAMQVDFTREKLVLFAWTGRSGERMTASIKRTGEESTVVFSELPRIGDGFVKTNHVHLYVIGKDVKWSLGPAPEGVD